MEEIPFGRRDPDDELSFKKPSTDLCIRPDVVSPAIESYFRIPAIWIGQAPASDTVQKLNPAVHHSIVLIRTLKCGIEVRAQRDGTFSFDFSEWPLAPIVVIPGFRRPSLTDAVRVPPAHTAAEELAEKHAILRAQVMNLHQACLTTAEAVLKKRGALMGYPITVAGSQKAISFNDAPRYPDDIENVRSLARNVLNNSYGITGLRVGRRVIENEVAAHSLDLLDEILSLNSPHIIQMVEAIYIASFRKAEKRFGEAVALGWTVCEQLAHKAWKSLLADLQSAGGNRMSADRVKKLTGRDYTASAVIEALEINGRIDHELYRLLEIARKSRNKWAHEMRSPKESDAYFCLRAAQSLLRQVTGIRLLLQSNGPSGVTQWPIWLWEQEKSRRR